MKNKSVDDTEKPQQEIKNIFKSNFTTLQNKSVLAATIGTSTGTEKKKILYNKICLISWTLSYNKTSFCYIHSVYTFNLKTNEMLRIVKKLNPILNGFKERKQFKQLTI